MVRRLWWLTAVMALVISEGARAQYQGYLPVQSGVVSTFPEIPITGLFRQFTS